MLGLIAVELVLAPTVLLEQEEGLLAGRQKRKIIYCICVRFETFNPSNSFINRDRTYSHIACCIIGFC